MDIIEESKVHSVKLLKKEKKIYKGMRNAMPQIVVDLIRKVVFMKVGEGLRFSNDEWYMKSTPAVVIPRYLKARGFNIKLNILKTVEPAGWLVVKKSHTN